MITQLLHDDVRELGASIAIASPTRYTILGEPRDVSRLEVLPRPGETIDVSPRSDEVDDAGRSPEIMLAVLETDIYQRLYRRPVTTATRSTPDIAEARDFLTRLDEANAGGGSWEPEWRLVDRAGEDASVEHGGVVYHVACDRVRIDGDGRCRVRVGKAMTALLPGYYLARSDADEPFENDAGAGPVVRFYWSLDAVVAPRYLAEITRSLNEAGVPFRTKVIAHPANYGNADAGVLYIRKGFVPGLVPRLRAVQARLEPELRDAVPMFAHRLARGLAVAEDPHDGASFGQSRSRVAARGLWAGFVAGDTLDGMARAFAAHGLDPRRPYLGPGSEDIYEGMAFA
jgi:hypothetical protein